MTLRRLFATLIALAVMTAAPGLAPASAAAGADCPILGAQSADNGCCGGTDMSSCSLPCTLALAAIGRAADSFAAVADYSPLQTCRTGARSVSRPPDTAPPKTFSA